MEVKCYLAKGPEQDQTMMQLLAIARRNGQPSLGGLSNDRAGISLSKNREALILVGGRSSIHDFLIHAGSYPLITGVRPFLVSFARKERILGKNETCLKIVSGMGHRPSVDGSEFIAIGQPGGGPLSMTPPELAHNLHFAYGWG